MENLKVDKIIICKQEKESENYEKFKKIVKEKRIKVIEVKMGDELNIEKDLKFQILWPKVEQIEENILNNNSIVAKLNYKGFSVLFTGDIEEIAEKAILEENKNIKSTILKIAHHGSKSSSTEEFLNAVMPKIALIGVGQNNKFGHPSQVTLDNLKDLDCQIYRTDLCGEISIKVNRNGKIKVLKHINKDET